MVWIHRKDAAVTTTPCPPVTATSNHFLLTTWPMKPHLLKLWPLPEAPQATPLGTMTTCFLTEVGEHTSHRRCRDLSVSWLPSASLMSFSHLRKPLPCGSCLPPKDTNGSSHFPGKQGTARRQGCPRSQSWARCGADPKGRGGNDQAPGSGVECSIQLAAAVSGGEQPSSHQASSQRVMEQHSGCAASGPVLQAPPSL